MALKRVAHTSPSGS